MTGQSEEYFQCPYCGERISVLVDHSVAEQRYFEDCEVCCRSIDIGSTITPDGAVHVTAARADD